MNRMIKCVSLVEGLIVCITTGNILEDPTEVVDVCAKPIEVDADIDAVRSAVFGRSRLHSR